MIYRYLNFLWCGLNGAALTRARWPIRLYQRSLHGYLAVSAQRSGYQDPIKDHGGGLQFSLSSLLRHSAPKGLIRRYSNGLSDLNYLMRPQAARS